MATLFLRRCSDGDKNAEAAAGTAAKAAALDDDSDDIDIAQLGDRSAVSKGALKPQLRAAVRQGVAQCLSASHDEVDGLVVDDIGAADVADVDATDRLAIGDDQWPRFLGAKGGGHDQHCEDCQTAHRRFPFNLAAETSAKAYATGY